MYYLVKCQNRLRIDAQPTSRCNIFMYYDSAVARLLQKQSFGSHLSYRNRNIFKKKKKNAYRNRSEKKFKINSGIYR